MIHDPRHLAAHILRSIAGSQLRGRAVRLDRLATSLGVRRKDVRAVVVRLHREGHVDAARLRLTLTGLALAAAMRPFPLASLRRERDERDEAAPLSRVA